MEKIITEYAAKVEKYLSVKIPYDFYDESQFAINETEHEFESSSENKIKQHEMLCKILLLFSGAHQFNNQSNGRRCTSLHVHN